jgi:hypothetical protein
VGEENGVLLRSTGGRLKERVGVGRWALGVARRTVNAWPRKQIEDEDDDDDLEVNAGTFLLKGGGLSCVPY